MIIASDPTAKRIAHGALDCGVRPVVEDLMALFQIVIVPCTISPIIREMHTQRRLFEAPSLTKAKQMARDAFRAEPDWLVESVRPA